MTFRTTFLAMFHPQHKEQQSTETTACVNVGGCTRGCLHANVCPSVPVLANIAGQEYTALRKTIR